MRPVTVAGRTRSGHGGLHPEPPPPGDQRTGDREGARGQAAGGERRVRRHLGVPPDLVAEATDEFDRVLGERPTRWTSTRRRRRCGCRSTSTSRPHRGRSARTACVTTSTSGSSTSRPGCEAMARRPFTISWRMRDRGNRTRAGVAVGAARRPARGRTAGHAGVGSRAGGRRAREDPFRGRQRVLLRRGPPKESRELFEQVALSDDFVEFLAPAYGPHRLGVRASFPGEP